MSNQIFYITKEKLEQLKKEYNELSVFERGKIMGQEAPKMLESEDLNAEFVSFQEDIDSLRSRIDELKNILDNYELIKKPSKEKQVFVNLGAKVKLESHGKKDEFMIVGTLDADPNVRKVSNESPIGKALLGRKVGDEIIIDHPKKIKYKIKNINYEIS